MAQTPPLAALLLTLFIFPRGYVPSGTYLGLAGMSLKNGVDVTVPPSIAGPPQNTMHAQSKESHFLTS